MFAPPPNSIIGDDGLILPEVIAARHRGVLFDVGNGVNGHLRWDRHETEVLARHDFHGLEMNGRRIIAVRSAGYRSPRRISGHDSRAISRAAMSRSAGRSVKPCI